jgi:hypothetical protein
MGILNGPTVKWDLDGEITDPNSVIIPAASLTFKTIMTGLYTRMHRECFEQDKDESPYGSNKG